MELTEKFLVFEKDNDLFKREIYGFHYWIYLRELIFYNYLYKIENYKIKRVNKVSVKEVNWNYVITSFLYHNPLMKCRNSQILFFQDPVVYNPEYEYYECNITPIIIDYFRKRSLLIADFNRYASKRKLRFPETTFLVEPSIKTALTRKWNAITKHERKLQLELEYELESVFQGIYSQFGVSIDRKKMINLAYYYYVRWTKYSQYYKKLLRKKRPKLIIEQCYYSFPKMVLNEVAKEEGILTVELQHGTMGPSHIAYNILCKNVHAFLSIRNT